MNEMRQLRWIFNLLVMLFLLLFSIHEETADLALHEPEMEMTWWETYHPLLQLKAPLITAIQSFLMGIPNFCSQSHNFQICFQDPYQLISHFRERDAFLF